MDITEKMKYIRQMKDGKKVSCWHCEKGVWKPLYTSPEKAHCFTCNNCGKRINLD